MSDRDGGEFLSPNAFEKKTFWAAFADQKTAFTIIFQVSILLQSIQKMARNQSF